MGKGNLGFDDDFMATMLGDFLDESQGYLTNLNDNLLVLEELVAAAVGESTLDVDLDLLNEMFRDAHSLKGLSAMLQLGDINSLTHKIENVFDAARDRQLPISRNVVDVMFEAFDRLAGMVDCLKDPTAAEVHFQPTVDRIQGLLQAKGETVSDTPPAAPAPPKPVAVETPVCAAPVCEAPAAPAVADPLAGLVNETDIPDKYLAIFIDETGESLDVLGETLLLDEAPIDPVLVICHRIKGAAASIGLHRCARLAHVMEDLLQELRETGRGISDATSDALMFGVDQLRSFVECLKTGQQRDDGFAEAILMLERTRSDVLGTTSAPAASTETPAGRTADSTPTSCELTAEERSQIIAASPAAAAVVTGVVAFDVGLPLVGVKARLVYERLADVGQIFCCIPEEGRLEDCTDLTRMVVALATEVAVEHCAAVVNLEGINAVNFEKLATTVEPSAPAVETPAPPPSPVAAAEPASEQETSGIASRNSSSSAADAGGAKGKPAETLRVDIDRLDQLMNLAGQLVINKARFGQIGEKLKSLASRKQSAQRLANVAGSLDLILADADALEGASPSSDSLVQGIHGHVQQIQRDLVTLQEDIDHLRNARSLVNDLSEAVHQLERVSDGIQKSVMDTRMVPIGPLFSRFKRVVRDITRGNGKDIQLVIRGDKTELDKRMIDELGDPLIHMVRNSADHGAELPQERLAAGKAAQATITLDAFHRGNRIFVQVRDDGKGLDPDKIRAKAVAKGIITQQDAERLTREQALQLIWEPGFSTAEQVTEVSGRGMGMDIVRSKIEQLNGSVELESRLGEGTVITIKLPLTMAILPSLLTVISDDVFAL
ncbi:MAG: chemotaxis protein CheA, partial [Planctomycetales bacterium]|nr:chemotaxis protein CheA [Planctomycetales bacterium]